MDIRFFLDWLNWIIRLIGPGVLGELDWVNWISGVGLIAEYSTFPPTHPT